MAKLKLPSRLITTTIFMALILVLIVVVIFSLINEKGRIQSALKLSQQNREQILKTGNITESLLLVEVRFKEYCTTFDKSVFEEYKAEVNTLADNIQLLQQTDSSPAKEEGSQIALIFEEKNKEADIYLKLKLITDSLITSVGSLEENQLEIESYIGNRADTLLNTNKKPNARVDTLSVTETKEIRKKGLFGKIKSAFVGETIKQNIETKIRVHSPDEQSTTTQNAPQEQVLKALKAHNKNNNTLSINKLMQKVQELRVSELKLIKLNNSLIAEVRKLIDEIKNNVKEREAKQNNSFLNSVQNSTNFIQNILIVLMLLACTLAAYILILAYKNNKFQNHIIDLNKKVTKDSIAKDKFFSIISHDLMNPFNTLLGFSEMLTVSAKNGDKDECVEYSSIVHQSTKRILNLLQNLLVWFRVQNGKMKYTPKPIKIDDLVSNTMMIVVPIAQNKGINIDWNAPDNISATVDTNMIGSVLQNLATNAIKFTQRGGKVTVSATVEDNYLKFTVSDTGVGMNEEQIDKLFRVDKNSSSKGTDNEVGTGLGLIICKEFVESNQGKIWVDSTPGKGSNFYFTVPLNQ